MNSNPPTKLSDALDLAATDVEECLGRDRIVIDMRSNWHKPEGRLCRMCAGGAMLHVRLGLSLDDEIRGSRLPRAWANVAHAIDSMRFGNVNEALFEMAGRFCPEDLSRRIDDLGIEPNPIGTAAVREFCAKFRQAAEILRAEGF